MQFLLFGFSFIKWLGPLIISFLAMDEAELEFIVQLMHASNRWYSMVKSIFSKLLKPFDDIDRNSSKTW